MNEVYPKDSFITSETRLHRFINPPLKRVAGFLSYDTVSTTIRLVGLRNEMILR